MNNETLYGTICEFDTPKAIYHAAEKLRDEGFKDFEVYTPFPIHGMDDAMGLSATKLPWIVLGMGLIGLAGGVCLSTWSSSETWFFGIEGGYKMITSSKPDGFEGIFEFIPVIFETTILLSAFGAVFGMFALNGLPKFHHPLFKHDPFAKVTDDGFFIAIEAKDPLYNESKVKEILEKVGGQGVTTITD